MTTPSIEPLRLTRAMILQEAAECDALADASQRDAAEALDRGDDDTALMREVNAAAMRKAARSWRAYADSPDGRPPVEEVS